jgi:Protein of unknown function (DUF3179)
MNLRRILIGRDPAATARRSGAWIVIGALLILMRMSDAGDASDTSAWRTDFAISSVPLEEIEEGGPPKDGIPAIDEPRFVNADQATSWLGATEPVVVVQIDAVSRAYPIQILIWHEIVNDVIGDVPVAVTFCPLCNASLAFDRRLDGTVLDFGTTGRLRMNDMIMYDRQTESWWQQIQGEAIVGELTGAELLEIPSRILAFEDFRAAFPDGEVLSRDTGVRRDYGRNPYTGYDSITTSPFLAQADEQGRLRAMERVLAVTVADQTRLYPFSDLAGGPLLEDRLAEVPVVIFLRPDLNSPLDSARIAEGRAIVAAAAYDARVGDRELRFEPDVDGYVDTETGSSWDRLGRAISGQLSGTQLTPLPGGVHFAYAWLSFYPQADVYGSN